MTNPANGAVVETDFNDWYWYSSDPNVLEVANEQGSNKMEVNVKGAGSAMIMAWYEPSDEAVIGWAITDTITVSKRPLEITATSPESIYVGGTVPELPDPATGAGYAVGPDGGGLADGDSPSGLRLAYSSAPDNTKPGTYAVVPSGASVVKTEGGADVSANYSISYVNGALTVKPKETQVITADAAIATYGQTEPASVNASVTSAVAGTSVGTLSYAVKDGKDCVDVDAESGALTIKKAGTVTVAVTAAGTDTCAQTTEDVTVMVQKAEFAPATVIANGWTYDGAERRLVYAGAFAGTGVTTVIVKTKKAEKVDREERLQGLEGEDRQGKDQEPEVHQGPEGQGSQEGEEVQQEGQGLQQEDRQEVQEVHDQEGRGQEGEGQGVTR